MSDWDDELTGNQTRNRIEALESQLAAARAEVVRLSGKTGFCLQCEAYAKERDRYKQALELIVNYGRPVEAPKASYAVCHINEIAKYALLESGGTKS
jgi:hypothetical protein